MRWQRRQFLDGDIGLENWQFDFDFEFNRDDDCRRSSVPALARANDGPAAQRKVAHARPFVEKLACETMQALREML